MTEEKTTETPPSTPEPLPTPEPEQDAIGAIKKRLDRQQSDHDSAMDALKATHDAEKKRLIAEQAERDRKVAVAMGREEPESPEAIQKRREDRDSLVNEKLRFQEVERIAMKSGIPESRLSTVWKLVTKSSLEVDTESLKVSGCQEQIDTILKEYPELSSEKPGAKAPDGPEPPTHRTVGTAVNPPAATEGFDADNLKANTPEENRANKGKVIDKLKAMIGKS